MADRETPVNEAGHTSAGGLSGGAGLCAIARTTGRGATSIRGGSRRAARRSSTGAMNFDQNKVALAAVLVSLAAVAVGAAESWHTTDVAHTDAHELLGQQRAQSDTVELRAVLDNAASELALAVIRLRNARTFETERTEQPLRRTLLRLQLQLNDVIKSRESLSIRLGPGAGAARDYRRAGDLILGLVSDYLASGPSGPAGTAAGAGAQLRRARILKSLVVTRADFIHEANRLAASILPPRR